MKIIPTNYMPEVVLDLLYDSKKILESCPQKLGGWVRAYSPSS
jgi:hypothetical protein